MKREPKVKRAWAIVSSDDSGKRPPWSEVGYCEVWLGRRPQIGPGEYLARVEIRPASKRKKAKRKAKHGR